MYDVTALASSNPIASIFLVLLCALATIWLSIGTTKTNEEFFDKLRQKFAEKAAETIFQFILGMGALPALVLMFYSYVTGKTPILPEPPRQSTGQIGKNTQSATDEEIRALKSTVETLQSEIGKLKSGSQESLNKEAYLEELKSKLEKLSQQPIINGSISVAINPQDRKSEISENMSSSPNTHSETERIESMLAEKCRDLKSSPWDFFPGIGQINGALYKCEDQYFIEFYCNKGVVSLTSNSEQNFTKAYLYQNGKLMLSIKLNSIRNGENTLTVLTAR